MSIVFKGKKGAGTVESGDAVVGTSSRCHLVLEDPMVAERHLAFREKDGAFLVVDLGSSSGIFLNGLQVEGEAAIPETGEASIVLGVSRLLTTVDKEKRVLTVTVKEASFFYDKKADPLRWVRSEVEFGRFRPVRVGNWLAIGAAFLLFVLACIPPVGRRIVDPGPIADVHANAVAKGNFSSSCDACHADLKGTPPSKCAPCHEDIVEHSVHPKSWDGLDCVPCHLDHRGTGTLSLTAAKAPETCARCHDENLKPKAPSRAMSAAEPWVTVAYDTFPHAAHLGEKAKSLGVADCRTCHQFRQDGSIEPAEVPAGKPKREFQRIPYERCNQCHGKDGLAKTSWEQKWHGTDGGPEHCLECHAKLHEPALRTVERVARSEPLEALFSFGFSSRDHHPQLEAEQRSNPEACVKCHRDGKVSGSVNFTERPFPHGVHLTRTRPGEGERMLVDGQCRECHREILEAKALASPSFRGATGDCKSCHDKGMEEPVARKLPDPLARVNDFPHAVHLASKDPSLAAGCAACHTVASDVRDAHQPATLPGARSCLDCHKAHAEVGGGFCAKCHAPGDPVYTAKPLLKAWPTPNKFQHRSRGHVDVECNTCHLGTETAKTLRDVVIPTEADPSCRTCHIEQKARFHWK